MSYFTLPLWGACVCECVCVLVYVCMGACVCLCTGIETQRPGPGRGEGSRQLFRGDNSVCLWALGGSVWLRAGISRSTLGSDRPPAHPRPHLLVCLCPWLPSHLGLLPRMHLFAPTLRRSACLWLPPQSPTESQGSVTISSA